MVLWDIVQLLVSRVENWQINRQHDETVERLLNLFHVIRRIGVPMLAMYVRYTSVKEILYGIGLNNMKNTCVRYVDDAP